jgi:hypothetical protein
VRPFLVLVWHPRYPSSLHPRSVSSHPQPSAAVASFPAVSFAPRLASAASSTTPPTSPSPSASRCAPAPRADNADVTVAVAININAAPTTTASTHRHRRIVPCPPRRSRLASRVSRRVVARVVARASRRDVSRIVSRVSRARLARARLAIDRAPSRRRDRPSVGRGRSNTISILACNRAALHGDSSPFKAGPL